MLKKPNHAQKAEGWNIHWGFFTSSGKALQPIHGESQAVIKCGSIMIHLKGQIDGGSNCYGFV